MATPDDNRVGDFDAAISGRADSSPGDPDAMKTATDAGVDAATTGTPDADTACTTQSLDLLANGAFDQGATAWTENSGGGFSLITADSEITGVSADTGTFVAWLGGHLALIGTVSDEMYQDISVPADATTATLTGKTWIDTEEGSSAAYDTLEIQVLDAQSGAVLETVVALSNIDSSTGWVGFSQTLTSTYAGQTVRFRCLATMDDILLTAFLLDSLVLETTSCQ